MKKASVFSQDKIFLHGDRVRDYVTTGTTVAPVTMELDLTNNCNNRCPNCTGYNDNKVQLGYYDAKEIIRQIAEIGARGIIFTGGGEPMMHKYAGALVRYAHKNMGLDVGFITSGQRPKHVTDHDLENIVKNTQWIRVSLDAGSPERYKAMHGLNANGYRKALDFIEAVAKKKKETGSGTTLGVGYLTGIWEEDMEREDADLAAIYSAVRGADYFQLRPLHGSQRNTSLSKIVEDSLNVSFPEMQALKSSHKYDHMDTDFGVRDYDFCHGAHFASVIGADANLYLCCHLRGQESGRIGNVLDEGLDTLWTPERINAVADKIDVHKCLPYCRADNMNRSLDAMYKEYRSNEHKNFL